jgi:predicted GIY-YIG superfamily endonuclease
MDYFAYVLRNSAGRRYIGISSDPVRRLEQQPEAKHPHALGQSVGRSP